MSSKDDWSQWLLDSQIRGELGISEYFFQISLNVSIFVANFAWQFFHLVRLGKNWSFDRCVQYCGSEEVNCDHALSLTYPSQKEQMIARFQKSFMCLAWGRSIWATTSVDNFFQTEQTNWNVEWDITWLYMKRENRYFKIEWISFGTYVDVYMSVSFQCKKIRLRTV